MKRTVMVTAEQLLDDAIAAMTDLHEVMEPDENEECAIIGPEAIRRFVDAHARLMYERERLTPNVKLTGSALLRSPR